MAYFTENI